MDFPEPHNDFRPWGTEVWLTRQGEAADERPAMVKIITVRAGEALSLQYHSDRDEVWHVISGEGTATVDGREVALRSGSHIVIPRLAKHRVSAGSTDLVFVECAFGDFDEADIVRLDDRYGRT